MIKNFQFKHLRNSAEKDFKIVARNSKWYSFSHPGGRSNFLDKSLYMSQLRWEKVIWGLTYWKGTTLGTRILKQRPRIAHFGYKIIREIYVAKWVLHVLFLLLNFHVQCCRMHLPHPIAQKSVIILQHSSPWSGSHLCSGWFVS